jgi:hypothetical protein
MWNKLGGAVMALCLIVWPAVGNARNYDLQPSSSWLMDYAPDSCRLMRKFGTDDDQVVVQMTRYQPSDRLELNLIGNPLTKLHDASTARVRFGTTGDFARVRAFPGGTDSIPALFLAVRLDNAAADGTPIRSGEENSLRSPIRWTLVDEENGPAVEPGTEAGITDVTVEVGQRTIHLQLGDMTKPMAALRKCTEDLVHLWGLDPVAQAGLASPPKPVDNLHSWLTTTYTNVLAFDSERAIVHFRLMVDTEGRPSSCTVQSNIEVSQHFSTPGCAALMKHARFTPARSPDGRAVASYYTLRSVWFMPRTAIERRLMVQ